MVFLYLTTNETVALGKYLPIDGAWFLEARGLRSYIKRANQEGDLRCEPKARNRLAEI